MVATVSKTRTRGIEIIPSGKPLGAEVRGVDLAGDYGADTIEAIRAAINEHSVICFRDQDISVEDQLRFTRLFGEPEKHVLHKQYGLKDHPEFLLIGNVKEGDRYLGVNDGALKWHSDLSYKREPTSYSVLYGIEIPKDETGNPLGDTRFVSMTHAYRTLPDAMKRRLAGLEAVHRYGDQFAERMRKKREVGEQREDLDAEQRASLPDVVHPVVRTHPVTGEKCLYVDEWFTPSIEGMAEPESRALLGELVAHATRPELVHHHRWEVGDVLMWDNPSTMHIATFDFAPTQRRLLRRTTCRGGVPR